MSHDSRIKLTKEGVSLSRLVFGAWRLLDSAARPDADQLARLIGSAVDLGLSGCQPWSRRWRSTSTASNGLPFWKPAKEGRWRSQC
jgi:hypothetical protein